MNAHAVACASAALLIGFAAHAGTTSPPADMELTAPCASCHREDGRNSFIPVLSGMDEHRFLQRMAEFRGQTQGDQIMHVIANALTAQETAAIAVYFAAHPVPKLQP